MAGLNLLAAIMIYWNTNHDRHAVAARKQIPLPCLRVGAGDQGAGGGWNWGEKSTGVIGCGRRNIRNVPFPAALLVSSFSALWRRQRNL